MAILSYSNLQKNAKKQDKMSVCCSHFNYYFWSKHNWLNCILQFCEYTIYSMIHKKALKDLQVDTIFIFSGKNKIMYNFATLITCSL